jgi:hypothetical protein
MVSKKPCAAIDHYLRAPIYTIGARRPVTSTTYLDVDRTIEFTVTVDGSTGGVNDFPPGDPRGVVRIKRLEHLAIDAFEFILIFRFVLFHKFSL